MNTKNTAKTDPVKNDHKTSPPGVSPDEAHASKGVSPGSRKTEVEETFNNSPQNAQSRQTEHKK
jgi:hypothetical protein